MPGDFGALSPPDTYYRDPIGMRPVAKAMLIAAFSANVSCATAPAAPHVTVSVRDETVLMVVRPLARGFSTSAVIRNQSATTVYMLACAPWVDREIGNEWQEVWAGACMGGTLSISGGDSLIFPVSVFWYYDRIVGYPVADERVTAGTYRVRFHFGWERDRFVPLAPLPSESVLFRPFQVTLEEDGQ
jgi:hypothetical protein